MAHRAVPRTINLWHPDNTDRGGYSQMERMTCLNQLMADIGTAIDNEPGEIILLLSGGKDSTLIAAILQHMKLLPRVEVVCFDPGSMPKNALEVANHFGITDVNTLRVKEHKDEFFSPKPVDVLPMTMCGATRKSGEEYTLTNVCCYENFWAPLGRAIAERNPAMLIVGGKDSDEFQTKMVGVSAKLFQPLAKLNDFKVGSLLDALHSLTFNQPLPLPMRLKLENPSVDCAYCTGWWSHCDSSYPPEVQQARKDVRSLAKLASDAIFYRTDRFQIDGTSGIHDKL